MKCPACFELMSNADEIHELPNNTQRMNLHCWNSGCASRIRNHILHYRPFMQVIIDDPNPWRCYEYGFICVRNGRRLLIQSGPQTVLSEEVIDEYGPIITAKDTIVNARVRNGRWQEIRRLPSFIELSTGDDMHIQVNDLVNRLIK